MKRIISLILVLIMTALLFTGCGNTGNTDDTGKGPDVSDTGTADEKAPSPDSTGNAETPKNVDVLRIGMSRPNDVFSAWSQSGVYGNANYHSFCQLNFWRIGENGQLTGDGCFFKKWDISDDNTEMVLHFDPLGKLMWNDGNPVTIDDVIFSFEHYKQNNVSAFKRIESVEVVSDTSILVKFNEPTAFGFMHGTWLTSYIMPKHIWENIEEPTTYRGADAAIGCGPFRLVSVDENAQISYYEAMPDYPIGDITIDKVELKSYDSPSSIIMAMLRDEVDVIYTYSAPTDHTLLPMIENDKNIDTGASIDPATFQFVFGMDLFPTSDINFRKAVLNALDYEQISQSISGVYGEVASTAAASPSQVGFNDSLPKNTRNLDKAREFLDLGGFIDADGDGFRDLPDGSPLDLAVLMHYMPVDLVPKYRRIIEIMQVNLAEVGVRVHGDEQALADNREYVRDTWLNNNYYFFLGTTTLSTATWGGIANYVADLPKLSTSSFGTYRDPEYLDNYTQMLTSTNYDDYSAAYKEIQRMNSERALAVVFDVTTAFHPYRSDRLTGWINLPGMGVINGATWYNTVLK